MNNNSKTHNTQGVNLVKCFVMMIWSLLLLNLSCKSAQSQSALPKAISDEITIFASGSTCRDAKVNEMKFQGKSVYVFEEGTCRYDKETNVREASGKLLGSLGGFAGNTIINGEDFSTAQFLRTVWNKQEAN